jgi:hypothetical protein
MDTNWRNVLTGIGMVTTVGFGATQAIAQSDQDDATEPSPVITEVREEAEWIMIENLGTGIYDASNHWVEFEYKGEVHQRRQLPEGTELGSVLIATGAKEVDNTDITFDFESEVINNDRTDAIALLTPEGEPVTVHHGINWKEDSDSSDKTTTTEEEPTTTTENNESSEETASDEEETTTTTEEDSEAGSDSEDSGEEKSSEDDEQDC